MIPEFCNTLNSKGTSETWQLCETPCTERQRTYMGEEDHTPQKNLGEVLTREFCNTLNSKGTSETWQLCETPCTERQRTYMGEEDHTPQKNLGEVLTRMWWHLA